MPIESKIMAKAALRTFFGYVEFKTHNPIFKSKGDPILQFVDMLSELLVEMLKDAEIHATIRDNAFNLISFKSESEGKSW
jgi:hypothetical protein